MGRGRCCEPFRRQLAAERWEVLLGLVMSISAWATGRRRRAMRSTPHSIARRLIRNELARTQKLAGTHLLTTWGGAFYLSWLRCRDGRLHYIPIRLCRLDMSAGPLNCRSRLIIQIPVAVRDGAGDRYICRTECFLALRSVISTRVSYPIQTRLRV